jgi:hypothetical protein
VKLLFAALASLALLFAGIFVLANRVQMSREPAVLTVPRNDFALQAQSLEKVTSAPISAPAVRPAPGPQVSVTPPLPACDPRASVSISAPRSGTLKDANRSGPARL